MDEATFVIFGATGDLARRSIIPAIYRLVKNGKVQRFAIVGVARRDVPIDEILSRSEEFIDNLEERVWEKIKSKSHYYQLDFYDVKGYRGLSEYLSNVESKHKLSGNRILYLSTLPDHYTTITKSLADSGTIKKYDPKSRVWNHIVYEKPFGKDLDSSKKINRFITMLLDEKQVYRIDHYLGKELVGNIALVRFTNRVFEPLWNKNHIESMQIVLSEKLGIKTRGEFYDEYGALKDVMQNHVFQMLALVAMEAPMRLTGEEIREEKAKVLSKVRVDKVVLGQYEGYKKELGVPKDSKTETYAALRLFIENNRWKGVPFYLKTGKKLDTKETHIHIKFRPVECLLSEHCPTDTNYLTIRVQPDEGISLEINAKVPRKGYEVLPIKMDFCHKCLFGPETPQAYENLLYEIIRGNQSTFVRNDEIEYAWRIIESVKAKKSKVCTYRPGSKGPKEADMIFTKKEKTGWM